jgi:hypothetical protein
VCTYLSLNFSLKHHDFLAKHPTINRTLKGIKMLIQITNAKQLATALFTSLALVLLQGCASVPPEAVDLSRRIGVEISKSQAAHLSTLDAFYKRLNEDNDRWIADIYLPKLSSTAISELTIACKKAGDNSLNCSQLNNNDVKRIMSRTIEFRDDIQRALSTNRDESASIINAHYVDLQSANSTITALLTSILDVKKATKESVEVISKASGIKIDTDKIERTLNEFLDRAGKAGLKISDLEKSLSDVIKQTAKN